jgi:hypothetical protein
MPFARNLLGRCGRGLLGILALSFMLTTSAFAQSGTSTVRGTVTDEQGRVLAGATVTLTDTDRNSNRTQTTNADGLYSFTGLPPGNYQISAEAASFKKGVVENVRATVDSTKEVNVSLSVGSSTEVITVTTNSLEAVINSSDASLGNNFVEQQIKQLPLEGRNVAALLSLQPGVTPGGAVSGSRSDQANLTLDGVDVNDQVNGTAFSPVLRATPDSISEFRVTTTNANASQGRSSGAQVSLITKSGTNVFHGTLFEYHRNTVTTANDYFNNLNGVARPKLIRNQFGGSIGGPILKDRLFFFFTYEGLRTAQGTAVNRIVPRASLGQGTIFYRDSANAVQSLSLADLNGLFPAVGTNPAALTYLAQAASRYTVNNNIIGDGLNTGGFLFNAPLPVRENTSIAKFDWNVDSAGKHIVSARFNYQFDNRALQAQQFPDTQTPNRWQHPVGTAISHTWTISGNKINTFRFGLTRDSFTNGGDSAQNALLFRDVFQPVAYARSFSRTSPVYNFTDDFTWTHGNHTIQVGGNVRVIRNRTSNAAAAFDRFSINFSFYAGAGSVLLTPITGSGRTISNGFRGSLQAAVASAIGRSPDYAANFNFDRQGNIIAPGQEIKRSFATEEYDLYGQDTWKIKPNLTLTYGLRYSLSRPVYEQNGLQARTTVALGDFFDQRLAGAAAGTPFNNPISIDLAGPANGKTGNYEFDLNNFQPRIALAWSPNFKDGFWHKLFGNEGDSVIRGGFAMTNDYYGTQIALQFDQNNRLGFSSSSSIASNTFNVTTRPAPQFTAPGQDVRSLPNIAIPGQLTFPRQQSASPFSRRIESSLDATVKAPTNYVFNLTFGRKLPKGLYVEGSYIGRIGRNLLATRDVTALNNLRDPQSGQDWYQAAAILADLRQRNVPIASVGPIPYFENLFRNFDLASGLADYFGVDFSGLSRSQAAYAFVARGAAGPQAIDGIAGSDWTTLQDAIDYASTVFGNGDYFFFHPQYGTLSAWGNNASSDYHAFTLSVRQRYKDQLSWDFNYTLSKSIDLASGNQNFGQFGGALVLNPIRPRDNRAFSAFDARHIINFNSYWEIPVGRGKRFFGGMNKVADAFLGGWQLTTIFRYNSGFPIDAPFDGRRWATNWNVQSNGVLVRDPGLAQGTIINGIPNLFRDPTFAAQSFRNPRAGETGGRSVLRDPGFVSMDFGLGKNFSIPGTERVKAQFRWEVFNATNTQRFTGADGSINYQLASDSTTSPAGPGFGSFTAIQGTPRVMQFALRISF